ncbi:MAG: hypothetical protein E7588_05245 [Ruminococcaceae bacterium]|nr:hypothetical protein [Oscillospiraceae bacterium]
MFITKGGKKLIYSLSEIREKVKQVADRYDIKEIRLFGSYFDGIPDENSDVDLIVSYGVGCAGLERIQFMDDLEINLKKNVDVINIKFLPDFMAEMDLTAKGRLIYER